MDHDVWLCRVSMLESSTLHMFRYSVLLDNTPSWDWFSWRFFKMANKCVLPRLYCSRFKFKNGKSRLLWWSARDLFYWPVKSHCEMLTPQLNLDSMPIFDSACINCFLKGYHFLTQSSEFRACSLMVLPCTSRLGHFISYFQETFRKINPKCVISIVSSFV